jgi:anti-anti-sigma regulatory factor
VTGKSPDIEVTVIGEVAVVRFRHPDRLLWNRYPRQDVGAELFALVDNDHHSLIVLDFGNMVEAPCLSGAFHALLVSLHHRLFNASRVLKLCNVPEPIMKQFQVSQLVKYFNIYPNLDAAIKSELELS